MQRPRWHDAVIVLALLVLTVIGIGALWGGSIAEMFDSDRPAAPSKEPSKGRAGLL